MFMIIPFLSPYAVKNIGIKTTELKYLYLVGGACTVVTARLIGKWTDQIGAFKVFMTLILISTMPILIYTNAGPMSLGHYLLMTTFFMTIISGRMIPCMTLISQVPESKDRGSFMGVLNSIRSLGTASATMVGGLIIGESASGELTNFGYAGFLAIGLTLLTIPMANQLEKLRAFRQFSER
jgi:predicted MFS family arabinose efflux permease